MLIMRYYPFIHVNFIFYSIDRSSDNNFKINIFLSKKKEVYLKVDESTKILSKPESKINSRNLRIKEIREEFNELKDRFSKPIFLNQN